MVNECQVAQIVLRAYGRALVDAIAIDKLIYDAHTDCLHPPTTTTAPTTTTVTTTTTMSTARIVSTPAPAIIPVKVTRGGKSDNNTAKDDSNISKGKVGSE